MRLERALKMTREENKKKYLIPGRVNNDIINDVIDGIYDDFESRTCENCKFSEKSTIYSELIFCMHYDLYMFDDSIPKDFGCNMFERKKNED